MTGLIPRQPDGGGDFGCGCVVGLVVGAMLAAVFVAGLLARGWWQ